MELRNYGSTAMPTRNAQSEPLKQTGNLAQTAESTYMLIDICDGVADQIFSQLKGPLPPADLKAAPQGVGIIGMTIGAECEARNLLDKLRQIAALVGAGKQ